MAIPLCVGVGVVIPVVVLEVCVIVVVITVGVVVSSGAVDGAVLASLEVPVPGSKI